MGYELVLRVFSAAIMFLIVCSVFWAGGIIFYAFIIIVTVIEYFEIFRVTNNNPLKTFLWGIFLVAIPNGAIVHLYSINPNIILWLAMCIWATDIFCYFVGKKFGNTKIIPSISPNKSWEGLLGGTIASLIVGIICAYQLEMHWIYYIYSAMIAPVSQAGDFFESIFKRVYKVKNSSKLIPGHGGLMDRVDGFITCAPFLSLIM